MRLSSSCPPASPRRRASAAGLVLVGVIENVLLPPILLHQYFDPETGVVSEPLKPDPRLPHYHPIERPYVPR